MSDRELATIKGNYDLLCRRARRHRRRQMLMIRWCLATWWHWRHPILCREWWHGLIVGIGMRIRGECMCGHCIRRAMEDHQ